MGEWGLEAYAMRQMSNHLAGASIMTPDARIFHELWQSSERERMGLEARILEYASDLRRNSSGGDDYPWEYARATADYLETLIVRSRGPAVAPAVRETP